MYYLSSRYYDAEVGRFINSDSYVNTSQGFAGFNMFAYCLNNPINYFDFSGRDIVSIQSMHQWWMTTMWWLCGVDTILPVGDAIYLGGIISLGIATAFSIEPIEIYDTTISLPDTKDGHYSESKEQIISRAISKAVTRTSTKIRNERSRYNYWIASYMYFRDGNDTYVPTTPLSYARAISYVRAGGNVFADSRQNAYRLALAVGYGREPDCDPAHGGLGYYKHYHAKQSKKKRMGGHIFYL